LASGRAVWSAEIYTIFGLDPAEPVADLDQFYALVHPDDRLRIRELRQQDEQGQVSRPCEYRLVPPAGEVRWIYRQCAMVTQASGKPARLVITHQDVTERENYRRVMSTLNSNVGNLIGQEFLHSLVANVARALRAETVYLGRFEDEGRSVRTEYIAIGGRIHP